LADAMLQSSRTGRNPELFELLIRGEVVTRNVEANLLVAT
jgi:hypothetical protein